MLSNDILRLSPVSRSYLISNNLYRFFFFQNDKMIKKWKKWLIKAITISRNKAVLVNKGIAVYYKTQPCYAS